MSKKIITRILLLLSLINSNYLLAQELNQSVDSNLRNNRFIKKITPDQISHFSIFAGPSLGGESRPNNFDGSVDEGGVNSWHQISLRYQLTKDTRLAINPRFTMDYNNIENNNNSSQRSFKLADPVIGIDTLWYENGRFSWRGSLNTAFMVFDEANKNDQMILNPGGFQTLNYQVNAKLSTGTWFWARYRYFANNDERANFPMLVSPFVTYSLNDKNSFTAFYQVEGTFRSHDEVEWDDNDQFNLSYSYQLTKALSLQPIVTVFRESRFNLSQGNINLWVSGSFL